MANTKGPVAALIDAGRVPDTRLIGARVKAFIFTIVCASQPSADTIDLGDLPANFSFIYGAIAMDVAPNSATLAIGDATTAGRFRAAAVVTQIPGIFGAAGPTILASKVRVIATIGAAALPATGNIYVSFFGTVGD